jgi:adenosylcobinamide-GDP ribazoletransferase
MSDLLTAFRFLTVLPLGRGRVVEPERMASSMAYFPLVGAWLGVMLWCADYGLGRVFPHQVVSALLVGLLALVTGGLHIDGLADTLDGIFGGRGDKVRILDIMKDSRIGAMGVVGVVLLLMLKYAAFDSLQGPARTQAIILAPALARWSQVAMAFRADYARKEGSLARPFVEYLTPLYFIVALLGATLIAYIAAGAWGLVPFAASALIALAARAYFNRIIGGVTGDTIGAVSELSEVMVLLLFLLR